MTEQTAARHELRHNDSEHTRTSDSLIAKYNSTVLIAGMSGIDSSRFGDNGLIVEDTRLVSRFCVTEGGREGEILSSSVSPDGAQVAVDILFGQVMVSRAIVVDNGCVHERITAQNVTGAPALFPLTIQYAADFASIFEMRGERRVARGRFDDPVLRGGAAEILSYSGLDGREYRAEFAFSEQANVLAGGQALFNMALGSGTEAVLYARYGRPDPDGIPPTAAAWESARARVSRDARAFADASAVVDCADPLISRWLERSLEDLNMLMMTTAHGFYPAAGVPWYATQFGRDGIITALQTLLINPQVARGVLGFLAANQAQEDDPAIAAETGKIGHEFRLDEMSMTGEKPFRRYYGGADTTLLFVMLAAEYQKRTGDNDFLRDILPNVEAALGWMERNRAGSPDGFVTYSYGNGGLLTQFWKDSDGSVVHRDDEWGARDLTEDFFETIDLKDLGGIVEALNARLYSVHGFPTQAVLVDHFRGRGVRNDDFWRVMPEARKRDIIRGVYRSKVMPVDPVAPAALQGYAYAAMMAASDIAEACRMEGAEGWREKAKAFRGRFEDRFWLEGDGFYALALDGEGRPCRVAGSDMGHLLYSGIVPPEKAARVVACLMDERFFSGYGIRTMAEGGSVAGFGYLTYHNGSIWPHDTAICAAGMARYGFHEPAAKILQALADASVFVDGRLFEVFTGAPRVDGVPPEKYHAACAPQAWSAGSAFMLVEAALGLEATEGEGVAMKAHRVPPALQGLAVRGLAGNVSGVVVPAGERSALSAEESGSSLSRFGS